ncbi:MAG: sulfatase [Acidobacteria bacterium]|nr:sulfatase [Acidobacteriota bacterium]
MLTRRAFTTLSGARLLAAQPGNARPNIVLFLADDHGWDLAGCYGHPVIRTPNLDALARQGMRFTRAFAASPTCAPSRAVLYTGLHSARNGLMGNHTGCRPGIRSITHYLKELGYRVVLANKTHINPPEVFGFEYVKATLPPVAGRARRYRTEGLDTAMVDRVLAEADKTVPLCLIVAESGPHVLWEQNRGYDPAAIPLPPITVDTPVTRRAMANYFEDITTTDARLGEVLASVRRHGFEENTLFIYTSDQGPEWPHSKWTTYDAGLRVPFLARWPGRIRAGAVTEAMISFTDITPTFVDAAGGKTPPGLDGSSFLNVLLGRQKEFRREIYASHSGDREMNVFPQRALRDTRFKYILNLHPDRKWTTHFTIVEGVPESHRSVYGTWIERAKEDAGAARLVGAIERHPAEELYDTKTDPWELNNLAARPEHAARLKRFRERMTAMRAALNDPAE